MATDPDWTTFTKRIPVKAPTSKIYRAWATRKGMENWFLRVSVFSDPKTGKELEPENLIGPGDTYSWFWCGWSDEVNQKGSILEANGTDFLKFTFEDPMVVSVRILPEDGGKNIVELKQEHIPTDDVSRMNFFVGCGEGWTFYLANLKSILEGGVDLRNHDEQIKRVINS